MCYFIKLGRPCWWQEQWSSVKIIDSVLSNETIGGEGSGIDQAQINSEQQDNQGNQPEQTYPDNGLSCLAFFKPGSGPNAFKKEHQIGRYINADNIDRQQ